MSQDKFEWDDKLVKDIVAMVNPFYNDIDGFLDKFKEEKTKQSKDWEIVEERKICEDGYRTGQTKITSVRRLSDGEVFSLGDEVESMFTGGWIIEGFENNEREMFVLYGPKKDPKVTFNGDGYWRKCKIEALKKVTKPKPLFISVDGFDVFEGQEVWVVNGVFAKPFKVIMRDGYYEETNDHYKFLSTEKAAEEYILLNRPCLSVNDILNTYEAHGHMMKYEFSYREAIKDLAKSKLSK